MKINPAIRAALDDTGLPWRVEHGKGHLKIRLNERLVGVMSASPIDANPRATKNTITQIKRLSREMKDD